MLVKLLRTPTFIVTIAEVVYACQTVAEVVDHMFREVISRVHEVGGKSDGVVV